VKNFLYIILILWNLQVKTSVVIQKSMLTNVLEFISYMKETNQIVFCNETVWQYWVLWKFLDKLLLGKLI